MDWLRRKKTKSAADNAAGVTQASAILLHGFAVHCSASLTVTKRVAGLHGIE